MIHLAAAILALAAQVKGAPLPIVPGTVALYQFEEGAGTTVADLSGQGHDGILSGDCAWVDGALDLSATAALMTVPPIEVGATWTIQCWVKVPLAKVDYTLGGFRSLTCAGAWHHHVCTDSVSTLGITLPESYRSSGLGLTQGEWRLLSVVGSGGQTTFYIDGGAVHATMSGQEVLPILYIGNYSGGFEPWGVIDSFRVLNVTRSQAQIAADFALAPVPAQASAPSQYNSKGGEVATGGLLRGDATLRVVAADPYSDLARAQVEVKPIGSAFDGSTGLHDGDLVGNGQASSALVAALAAGPYHWRARALGSAGPDGPWIEFGTNGDFDADFEVPPNHAPTPAAAVQFRGNDGAPLVVGEAIFDAGGVVFEAAVSDPDGDDLRLQVELRPLGVPFTGQATGEGDLVSSGTKASCRLPVGTGPQHWQARSVDALGAASPWTAFGGNSEVDADFTVAFNGSAGTGTCVGSAAATRSGTWILSILAVSFLPCRFVRRPRSF